MSRVELIDNTHECALELTEAWGNSHAAASRSQNERRDVEGGLSAPLGSLVIAGSVAELQLTPSVAPMATLTAPAASDLRVDFETAG